MIKFADLGIKSRLRGEIYNCKTISIKSIIDKEIVILGVTKTPTHYGDNRYLLHCCSRVENDKYIDECKFFTNANSIKDLIDQIPADKYPVITKIKIVKIGNKNIYQLC